MEKTEEPGNPELEGSDNGAEDRAFIQDFCRSPYLHIPNTTILSANAEGIVILGGGNRVEYTTPSVQVQHWQGQQAKPEESKYRPGAVSRPSLTKRFRRMRERARRENGGELDPRLLTILAEDRGGREREFYLAEQIRAAVKNVIEARQEVEVKVDKNGFYYDETYDPGAEDSDRGVWCTIDAFYKNLPPEVQKQTSATAIRRYAKKSCQSMPALDSWGRLNKDGEVIANVYPLTELKKLPILTIEIRVDPETGIYTDENGEDWASRRTWWKICGVIPRALEKGIKKTFGSLKNMTTIKAFGKAKRVDDLYCETEILQALACIFEAEHISVNGVTTTIEEINGGVHETLYLSQKELVTLFPQNEVPRYAYPRKMKKEGRVNSVDRSHGGKVPSFEIKTIQRIFTDRIKTVLESEVRPEERHGQVVTLEEYFTLNPEALEFKDAIFLSLDDIPRFRQVSESGRIKYTYPEKDLDKIVKGT